MDASIAEMLEQWGWLTVQESIYLEAVTWCPNTFKSQEWEMRKTRKNKNKRKC